MIAYMGNSTRESLAKQSDRVFFSLLVLMKGIVMGYGSMVLLGLLGEGAPWQSTIALGTYVAWFATFTLVTLTFVSQALGSSSSILYPTTPAIALTFCLAIAELVSFGLLKPMDGHGLSPVAVRSWLAAVAVANGLATVFISVVLHQTRSESYPHAVLTDAADVKGDRRAACSIAVASGAGTAVLHIRGLLRHGTWIAPIVIALPLIIGLVKQQKKTARW
jgi:hypothetical protein